PLRAFFAEPTVAGLSRELEARRGTTTAPAPTAPARRARSWCLSPAQDAAVVSSSSSTRAPAPTT
ncbi:hypothetical protein ACLESO_59250, partial [Pyxidicoccus sp. 3LG]